MCPHTMSVFHQNTQAMFSRRVSETESFQHWSDLMENQHLWFEMIATLTTGIYIAYL